MPANLDTSRLILRPWTDGDEALLGRLSGDPEVIRYIGNGKPWPPDRVRKVAHMEAEHWRQHGFGWRVALPKSGGAPVGFVMLNYLGEGNAGLDPREFEIGWWLYPSAWGQGLASEAARAVSQEGLHRVGAPSLLARIQPANGASLAVATRLGMGHQLDTTGRFGEAVSVYRLPAPEPKG